MFKLNFERVFTSHPCNKQETRRRYLWKGHDAYQKALNRLLRDLWVEKA